MMIRPLDPGRPADRATWLRLRRRLFPDCPDAMQDVEMDRHLAHGYPVFFASPPDGEPVGLIEVSVRGRVEHSTEDRVGYVEAWFVEPSWHGRGVGRRLMDAAEAWTRKQGLKELASDTDLGNSEGLAAHLALGFRETERIITLIKRLSAPEGGA